MNIYLTAIIRSKPAFKEDVQRMLENLVVQTRKEPACLRYDLHQGIDDEQLFVFYEIWENEAGLAAHNEQPYIRQFMAEAMEMLQEPPVAYLTRLK